MSFKRSANKSLIARRERLDLNKELQPFEQPRILGQNIINKRDTISTISSNHIRIQSETIKLMERQQ